MDFIDHNIQRYAETHTTPESDLLRRISRDTHAQVMMPRMLSGHLQGRVLSMVSNMIKPKTILEIGTYTGYSAICLAEGLHADGKLITIDINDELEDRVRKYIEEAGLLKRIRFMIGDAAAIIPLIEEKFDLVFIDADKVNYINYYELTLPSVKKTGWILADNVFFHGEVLQDVVKGKNAIAIQAFNEHIKNDDRVQQVMLSIRDGLLLIQKK